MKIKNQCFFLIQGHKVMVTKGLCQHTNKDTTYFYDDQINKIEHRTQKWTRIQLVHFLMNATEKSSVQRKAFLTKGAG